MSVNKARCILNVPMFCIISFFTVGKLNCKNLNMYYHLAAQVAQVRSDSS